MGARGVPEAPRAGRLVALRGRALAQPAGLVRAGARAIALPPVAPAADEGLGAAVRAQKESGGRRQAGLPGPESGPGRRKRILAH